MLAVFFIIISNRLFLSFKEELEQAWTKDDIFTQLHRGTMQPATCTIEIDKATITRNSVVLEILKMKSFT